MAKTLLPSEWYNRVDHTNYVCGVDFLITSCSLLLSLSDMEKLEGLPVTPFMDRDKVTLSMSHPLRQASLASSYYLFMELDNLFPCLEVRSPSTTTYLM